MFQLLVSKGPARTFYGHLSSLSLFAMVWIFPKNSANQPSKDSRSYPDRALKTSFIGDQLPVWSINPIVDFVSNLRPLSTSYTPYQPERSQGTLISHWIYQCAISALTGFEAINTSLYDRSFAIYEAIACAIRTSIDRKESCLPVVCSPRTSKCLIPSCRKRELNFPS